MRYHSCLLPRLLDRVRVVLAGRAAEEVALGAPSTYGTSDLRVRGGDREGVLQNLLAGRPHCCQSKRFVGAPGAIHMCRSACRPAAGMSSFMLRPCLTRPQPLRLHPCLQDATRLAVRLVSNYGLSELGITTYAPVPSRLGFMQRSFEVTGGWVRGRMGGWMVGCKHIK